MSVTDWAHNSYQWCISRETVTPLSHEHTAVLVSNMPTDFNWLYGPTSVPQMTFTFTTCPLDKMGMGGNVNDY